MTLFVELMENPIFALVILPILIFSARIGDVTIGTIRIVFVSQGKKFLAPILGFFEIIIWLLAIGQIFNNLTNIIYYIAYAGGFAMGNYVGLIVENKISLGYLSLRLILSDNTERLIKSLKDQGYGMISITTEGSNGDVNLIILVIKRKNKLKVLNIIREIAPDAFISIEQVQSVKGGIFSITEKTKWDLLKRQKKK